MTTSLFKTVVLIFLFTSLRLVTISQEYYFDHQLYSNIVKDSLEGNVKGYGFSLWAKDGGPIVATYGGKAQDDTEPGGVKYFSENTTLCIGSTSKIITTAAVLRAIEKNPSLHLDDKMVTYFPYKWKNLLHNDFKLVTIRQLLQHRSGFDRIGDNGLLTRTRIQQGYGQCENVPCSTGTKSYSNFNMAVFQMILAYMINPLEMQQAENLYSGLSDTDYDKNILNKTSEIYFNYVRDSILTPNFIDAHCNPAEMPDPALMYSNPADENGLLFPNTIYSSCAAGGWTMTVDNLSLFMYTLKYTEKIISHDSYKLMENYSTPSKALGWYFNDNTNEGVAFHHGGVRSYGSNYAFAMLMSYPNGMHASALVNSASTSYTNKLWVWTLRNHMINAYNAASCPPVVHVPPTFNYLLKSAKASETVIAQTTVDVEPLEDIRFRAGKNVVLLPGFHAKEGSKFKAYISPCVEKDGPDFDDNNLIQEDLQGEDIENLEQKQLSNEALKMTLAKIYPNPSGSLVHLVLNSNKENKIDVQLYDVLGNCIAKPISKFSLQQGQTTVTFNIDFLKPGLYIYKIQTVNGIMHSGKLVKAEP